MKVNAESAQKQRDIFARNFRRYLQLAGKDQADIVRDLIITSSTVSDWANAKKYPRVDKMQALADYLGVLMSDLREEKLVTTTDDELPQKLAQRPKLRELMDILYSADDEGLDTLIRLAKMIDKEKSGD